MLAFVLRWGSETPMTDNGLLLILITTNISSACIAYLVTLAYWRDKHYDTLRDIAKERLQDKVAIDNARIIQRVYGDTLGLTIMERDNAL